MAKRKIDIRYIDDDRLVSEFIGGNNRAFDELHYKYIPQLQRYCTTFVEDPDIADDLAQLALIDAYNGLKKNRYSCKQTYHSWLFRVAHNVCIDHFRELERVKQIKTVNDSNFKLCKEIYLSPEQIYIETEHKENIIRIIPKLIKTLPEPQQEVVNMHIFEGLVFREIAEKQNVSINTVLGQMRYAIINLRKELQKEEYKELVAA